MCHIGCVRFAGYCGQMYRRHLFSYGGITWHDLRNGIIRRNVKAFGCRGQCNFISGSARGGGGGGGG